MGVVYRAFDTKLERTVALKFLPDHLLHAEEEKKRVLREARTASSLDHPNIGRLLEGGATDDGLPYFVMEYIEGTPLQQYCDENRLTVSERLILFRRVCDAVQYAHSKLIIHRDLKPSNILVTHDGIPKLLDFGIAKLTASAPEATLTAAAMMTPEYASPEQLRGQPITTASDVYSLGLLLYRLLTCHPAHVSAGAEEDPERPSMVAPNSRRSARAPSSVRRSSMS